MPLVVMVMTRPRPSFRQFYPVCVSSSLAAEVGEGRWTIGRRRHPRSAGAPPLAEPRLLTQVMALPAAVKPPLLDSGPARFSEHAEVNLPCVLDGPATPASPASLPRLRPTPTTVMTTPDHPEWAWLASPRCRTQGHPSRSACRVRSTCGRACEARRESRRPCNTAAARTAAAVQAPPVHRQARRGWCPDGPRQAVGRPPARVRLHVAVRRRRHRLATASVALQMMRMMRMRTTVSSA